MASSSTRGSLPAAAGSQSFDSWAEHLRGLFADAASPAALEGMQLMRSPPKHCRHRTQVAVCHGARQPQPEPEPEATKAGTADEPAAGAPGAACTAAAAVPEGRSLGLWDAAQKRVIPIDFEAAILSAPILRAMAALPLPETADVLWERLTAVHAHSTSAGELCLTLCYARRGAAVVRGRAEVATRAGPEALSAAQEAEWRAGAEAFRRGLLAAAVAAAAAGGESVGVGTGGGGYGDVRACSVVGQWRKYSVVVGTDSLTEEFTLADGGGRRLTYRQINGQFSNPNPEVARASLDWLCETCRTVIFSDARQRGGGGGRGGRLLELHCGFGHSTIALAPHFDSVVGIELNRLLAATASHNLAVNSVTNATVLRMGTADAAAALLAGDALAAWTLAAAAPPAPAAEGAEQPQPQQQLERAERHGGACTAGSGGGVEEAAGGSRDEAVAAVEREEMMQPETDVLLVDPPRAGLDAPTLALARRFEHILYISCNPSALRVRRNAVRPYAQFVVAAPHVCSCIPVP